MATIQTPKITEDLALRKSTGLIVYPSLHWWVSTTQIDRRSTATEEDGEHFTEEHKAEERNGDKDKFDMGAGENFEKILPGNLKRGSVVALEGTRGTFKTTFAVNFLAKGLLDGESVLLIHFGECSLLQSSNRSIQHPIRQRIYRYLQREKNEAEFEWDKLILVDNIERNEWEMVASEKKMDIHVWKNQYNPSSRLIEMDFKSGMLLPEEFVSIVCEIIDKLSVDYVPIRRVVLDDVSLIGVSYPLLRSSSTTGQFFLSAFVHLMQYHKIDLVITGTLGNLSEVNESVYRAASLADAVVSCRYCNVFGQRSVVVRADGMMVGREHQDVSTVESVPALVKWSNLKKPDEQSYFELDFEQLEGLVGFESDNIHRPGLLLYLFSEYDDKNSVQARYNRSLKTLINSAIGRPQELPDQARNMYVSSSDVSVCMFDSKESEAIHDSICVLKGGPLDRTVIYTVDEFWATAEASEGRETQNEKDDKEKKGKKDEKDEKNFLTAGNIIYSRKQNPKSAVQRDGSDKEKLIKGTEVKKPETIDNQGNESIIYLEKPTAVRPYYANVLLLAFRSDIKINDELIHNIEDNAWVREICEIQAAVSKDDEQLPPPPPPKSWNDVKLLAEVLQESRLDFMRMLAPQQLGTVDLPGETNPANSSPPAFWFDRAASETLACALMDALVAGSSHEVVQKFRALAYKTLKSKRKNTKRLRKQQKQLCQQYIKELKDVSKDQLNEICALSDLFYMSGSGDRKQLRLVDNATVYLCWYSQLRELIDQRPELADKLNVCPLPGGGFTGDWFVGIARGSVSLGLGGSILDLLCSKEEEYKRFALGVGLPTTADFYAKQEKQSDKIAPEFFTWPLGRHVLVERLRAIHLQAISRAFIPQYTKFRSALATVAFQLTPMSGMIADREKRIQAIIQNVKRLPGQVQMLRGNL